MYLHGYRMLKQSELSGISSYNIYQIWTYKIDLHTPNVFYQLHFKNGFMLRFSCNGIFSYSGSVIYLYCTKTKERRLGWVITGHLKLGFACVPHVLRFRPLKPLFCFTSVLTQTLHTLLCPRSIDFYFLFNTNFPYP